MRIRRVGATSHIQQHVRNGTHHSGAPPRGPTPRGIRHADTTTRTVLVIGGGTSGNTLTALLRKSGIPVDLIEADPDWKSSVGAGITLQGNALRVLREAGVLGGIEKDGYAADGIAILAPDGTVLDAPPEIHTGGDDLPAHVGMERPSGAPPTR